MLPGRPQDNDNIQPRLGFAYQLNDQTVLRGGAGLYYPDVIGSQFSHSNRFAQLIYVTIPNDGRPDFATNPFNGPTPTYTQAIARSCDVAGRVPNCYERASEELAPPAEFSAADRYVADVVRCPAPASRRSWHRGRLHPQPEPQREGAAQQRQPALRREHGRRTCRSPTVTNRVVSELRRHRLLRLHRPFRLQRPADDRHQAIQQPVAVLGQLHAVDDQERRAVAAVQRPYAGAVPGRRRSRRRVWSGRHRPAASGGVQRHLGRRPRLPVERPVLLRGRSAAGRRAAAATCAMCRARRRPDGSAAPDR